MTISTEAGRDSGVGSGIVLTPNGLILTNDHVIAGGGTLWVRELPDGQTLEGATIVVEDATADLRGHPGPGNRQLSTDSVPPARR